MPLHPRQRPEDTTRTAAAAPATATRAGSTPRQLQSTSPDARTSHLAVQDSPRVQAERALHQRLLGGATAARPVAQRTIHEYADAAWHVKQRGTRGGHPLPADDTAGKFFNDVTGQQAGELGAVRAGLVDHMMQSGSLIDLGREDEALVGNWQALAAKLAVAFKAKADSVKDKSTDDARVDLGSLYLSGSPGNLQHVHQPKVEKGIFGEAASFVVQLMAANGQLAYIAGKQWLGNGHHVRVEMNYYANRPMAGDGDLGLHKDTGGDNLFVNLVFDNKKPTPATEWTQDRDLIDGPKKDVMRRHYGVPEEMLADFDASKRKLAEANTLAEGKEHIEGGVMPEMAYVSWVDELAWHATPALNRRFLFGEDDPCCEMLMELLSDKPLKMSLGEVVGVLDVLAALSESEASEVRKLNFSQVRLVFEQKALLDWIKPLSASQRKAIGNEVTAMQKKGNVKASGRMANELDSDGEKQKLELVRPTNVANRPRRNSDAKTLAEVKEAADEQPLRSFIRTWVRIMKGPPPKQ